MQSSREGARENFEEQPDAVRNSAASTLRSPRPQRAPCPTPAMPNGRCRIHGGLSPGAPKGNQHARKHGFYGAEEIGRRRKIAALVRSMRALAHQA
jgi:hypothetical protein